MKMLYFFIFISLLLILSCDLSPTVPYSLEVIREAQRDKSFLEKMKIGEVWYYRSQKHTSRGPLYTFEYLNDTLAIQLLEKDSNRYLIKEWALG